MSEIKTVALVGASGVLGPHVLKALLDANFRVTVLTRSKKPETEYSGVYEVVEVDFTSLQSLTAALKGIDAVVSTLGSSAVESQTVLIDAAVVAGVKRFIPSEYGSCTTNEKLETFPMYSSMVKVREHLQEKAKSESLTWTVLACGAFLDFVLSHPILVDFTNHKSNLLDQGDNRTSSTTLPNVGKAIAGILKNPEATKNRIVRTSEVIVTQNGLLKIARELRPDIQWELTSVQTSAMLEEALKESGAGNFGTPVVMKLLMGTALAGDTYGAAYDTTDNELLGIEELSQESLKNLVAEKLA